LCRKKSCELAFEEIERNLTAEKGDVDPEISDAKIRRKVLTLEEKIQEASKPLYLRRYE